MTYINTLLDPTMATASVALVLLTVAFVIGVYRECRRSSAQDAHEQALQEDAERRRKASWKLNRESNWVD